MRNAIFNLRAQSIGRWHQIRRLPPLFRFPTTILFLTVIVAIRFLTRNDSVQQHRELVERFGYDYADLRNSHFWQLFTGTWIQSEPGLELSMLLMVASAAVILEFLAGSASALIAMVVSDWISTILTAITLRVLYAVGNKEALTLLTHADSGSSVLAHAGWAAAAMLLPQPFRVAAYGLLLATSISQFWWQGLAPSIAHVFGVLIGGLIGWCLLSSGQNIPARS